MKPEVEKKIYEAFRDALREIFIPITKPADTLTDWPGGQAKAMREMATACSPQTHRMELIRLCERIEDLIDDCVAGALSKALAVEIERIQAALANLRDSSNALADFQEPYAGFSGNLRLALETGTRPWNLLAGFAGKHPYQIRRTELETRQYADLESFFDAFQSLILAFESTISHHTGKHFAFREAYDRFKSNRASES